MIKTKHVLVHENILPLVFLYNFFICILNYSVLKSGWICIFVLIYWLSVGWESLLIYLNLVTETLGLCSDTEHTVIADWLKGAGSCMRQSALWLVVVGVEGEFPSPPFFFCVPCALLVYLMMLLFAWLSSLVCVCDCMCIDLFIENYEFMSTSDSIWTVQFPDKICFQLLSRMLSYVA